MNKKLLDELNFILEEAEAKVGNKIEKVLLEMYWQIGYCLREYNEEELNILIKELSLLLKLEQEIFFTAYHLYKEYPIKKNIRRIAA
ncbi:MAG: hypothetical protein Q8R18_04835 [bacterium]|nr:hypothetical protein [bacterium]